MLKSGARSKQNSTGLGMKLQHLGVATLPSSPMKLTLRDPEVIASPLSSKLP